MKNLFEGLEALSATMFPKKCASCGKVYQSAEEYLKGTQELTGNRSGLKQSYDEDETVIVELYRNCECGSTLMNFYSDRRDRSPEGLKRRDKFADLLNYLVDNGMDFNMARTELLKVVRGEASEVIEDFRRTLQNREKTKKSANE